MTGPGWPNERGWLVIVATMLLMTVLMLIAFVPRLEDSQLFAAIAGGVVGAAFRDVIGMWTSSTKAGAELATKAMETVSATSASQGTTTADNVDITAKTATVTKKG